MDANSLTQAKSKLDNLKLLLNALMSCIKNGVFQTDWEAQQTALMLLEQLIKT